MSTINQIKKRLDQIEKQVYQPRRDTTQLIADVVAMDSSIPIFESMEKCDEHEDSKRNVS